MHGTALPGRHWLLLKLARPVRRFLFAVLDWEAAYCEAYQLQVCITCIACIACILWGAPWDGTVFCSGRRSEVTLRANPFHL